MQAIQTKFTFEKELQEIQKEIGNTSLKRFPYLESKNGSKVYAKLEWENLGGSVKARPAFAIIKDALQKGLLQNKTLLDASSGNTGIAYGSICHQLGIPVSLCLPENASAERIEILQELGVEIIYTSRFESTDGAQLKAQELVHEHPEKYFYADQYRNENNWKAHYETTAHEIWEQTQGRITHFSNALGSTGTFIGTSRKLKELNNSIQLIALQPDSALHGMEGWKHLETAIVPTIYDPTVADEVQSISTEEAYELIHLIKKEEGILISPSAAANLAAAQKIAKENSNACVVTTLADNADKYSEVIKFIFNEQ